MEGAQAGTGPALLAALEGLKLARREVPAIGEDAERWRWVSVGLIIALKSAAIAALSGYETAAPEDTADPADPGKVAPLRLLLRRVKSDRHLNPPEQLRATASQINAALRLATYRNTVIHGVAGPPPETAGSDSLCTLMLIRHMLVSHPAFDCRAHAVLCALIRDEVSALESQMAPLG